MTTAAPRAAAPPVAAPLAAREDEASPYDDVRVTSVRKIIAARLLESKTTNPHEYFTVRVEP
jgi:pyruvate dehydrogenase E2 component (dihydrolipoamide acetyltransferase)